MSDVLPRVRGAARRLANPLALVAVRVTHIDPTDMRPVVVLVAIALIGFVATVILAQ